MVNLIDIGIGVAIAAIVIGSVSLPILSGVNTTGWTATDITIFGFVSTFLILALLMGAIRGTGMTGD